MDARVAKNHNKCLEDAELLSAASVKEDVDPSYEEYLLLLQQKNRLLKKLKEKDDKQVEMEKREQGFVLYVSGANTQLGRSPTRAKSQAASRHSKTAGDTYVERKNQLYQELKYLEKQVGADVTGDSRAQTAPTAVVRKGWRPESVQIRTEGGTRMKVKAPGKLSGNYSEDFEQLFDGEGNSDENDDEEENFKHLHDASEHVLGSSSEDGSDDDELTLSFSDVKALRRSLEADESIKESIEAAKKRIADEKEDKENDSDNDDDVDEIEEELECANESIELRDSAVLGRLPHLASDTNASHSIVRESVAQSVGPLAATPKHSKNSERKALRTEHSELPRTPARQEEPLVVLRFSSTPANRRERILSATRRKSSSEAAVSDEVPSSVNKTEKTRSSAVDKQEVTLASSPMKTERPLSATRKSRSKESSQPDNNVDEVLRAMMHENKKIDVTQTSGFRTAPEKSKDRASPVPVGEPRPSSIATCSSDTEKTINLVTQKVRKMDPRQQRHLISLLARLELKEAPFKSLDVLPSPRGAPMRATAPLHSHISGAWKGSDTQESDPPAEQSFDKIERSDPLSSMKASVDSSIKDMSEGVDVNLEILSNWGDPRRVGLTEVQFYDDDGVLVQYEGSNIGVSGNVGDGGVVKSLCNRKTKTTKDRYMWSCDHEMHSGHPVELTFHLPGVTPADDSPFGLSKICIWNYNRGMKDLAVGVQHSRLFIGGELVWEGTVDKGCGNQVFDYCKVINLRENTTEPQPIRGEDQKSVPEPVVRSETVILQRSADIDERVPVIDSNSQAKKQPPLDESSGTSLSPRPPPTRPQSLHKSPRSSRHIAANFKSRAQSQPQSPELGFDQGRLKDGVLESLLKSEAQGCKLAEPLSTMRSNSTPNLSSTENAAPQQMVSSEIRGNSAALPARPPWLDSDKKSNKGRTSRSKSKSKPIWLDGEENQDSDRKRSESSPDVAQDIFSPRKSRSRPSSGRRSNTPNRQESEQEHGDKRDRRRDSASREEQFVNPMENSSNQKDNTKPRAGSEHANRKTREFKDSDRVPLSSGEPGSKSRQSERAKWRRQQEQSLEESLNVLSLFEKSHRGRITQDLDLASTGDALDQFLSSELPKPVRHSRDENIASEDTQHLCTKEYEAQEFEIPQLPEGKELILNIKDTWGDRHYVGLNGIEVFTDSGRPAEISEITADPLDINILPEYGNDPRVITNVVDGVYRTRDDMHLWLAPFTPRGNHFIKITFPSCVRIAMIRIWNYNKSRIHSFRGVRDVEIALDGSLIFRGEIARACGDLGAGDPFGDTILFTMDEEILDAMAYYDQTYELAEDEQDVLMYSGYFERPSTADRGDDSSDSGERPFTAARKRTKSEEVEDVSDSEDGIWSDVSSIKDEVNQVNTVGDCLVGQVLQLNFISTWGDLHYLGLTGLEVLGTNMETVPLTVDMIDHGLGGGLNHTIMDKREDQISLTYSFEAFDLRSAQPRDLNDLAEYGDDDRTLDKVIDGSNVVMSDEHMWLVPFTEGQDHVLTIDLGHRTQLLGLRVWNYNKSQEDTFRGARQVLISLDGKALSPPEGYLLRKGPGNVHFDFAQDIYFLRRSVVSRSQGQVTEEIRRPESRVDIRKLVPDYEVMMMPRGFVYQFQLFSAWGDPYYIGLNGLEFYDEDGYRIHLTENNVTAFPHSVNVLEGVSNDARTPDKLIDGFNDSNDGRHMWLAPILPGLINLIYVVFDEPVTVSMIKIWNYSKTPIRGVCAFGILVDDLLVYHGEVPQVPTVTRGILPNMDMPVPHHTVFFSDKDQFISSDGRATQRDGQDVQLTNDKRVVGHYSDSKAAGKTVDPALRPKTSVPSAGQRRK